MQWESSKYDLYGLRWDEIADIWVEDFGMHFGSAYSGFEKDVETVQNSSTNSVCGRGRNVAGKDHKNTICVRDRGQ
jgi:hypothetical protein